MPLDTFSPEKRSWIMAQVNSTGSKSTEQRFLSVLRCNGITGWRRSYPLYGRPDFVFPKARVAVFIDGCFWHGHPERCRMPKTNRDYWEKKIRRNVARDRTVSRHLRNQGWKVLRVWEHRVSEASTMKRLRKALSADEN